MGNAAIKKEVEHIRVHADVAQSIAEDALEKVSEVEGNVKALETLIVGAADVQKMIDASITELKASWITSGMPEKQLWNHKKLAVFEDGDKLSRTVVVGGFLQDSERDEVKEAINKLIVQDASPGVEEMYAYSCGSVGFARFESVRYMRDFLMSLARSKSQSLKDGNCGSVFRK